MSSSNTQATGTEPSGEGFRRHEYYVNYPHNPSSSLIARSNQVRDHVRTTFAWVHTIATDQVRRRVADGQLDPNDAHAEFGYRVKVISYVLRTNAASWLTPTLSSNMDTTLDLKKEEFKDQLFVLFRGMEPPPPDSSQAKEFVTSVTNAINNGRLEDGHRVHYWHSLAFFKYDSATRTIDAGMQTFHISMKVSRYMFTPTKPEDKTAVGVDVSTNKEETAGNLKKSVSLWPSKEKPVEMIKIEPIFTAVQFDFNDTMFESAKPNVLKAIEDLRHVSPVAEVDP